MSMSASGEIAVPESELDDGFGDELRIDGGKKKKFKPFQKMRKFFRGGSKKQRFSKEEGHVSLKSHSTSALQHMEEDEDDGGFKKVPVGLAGSRSISEDSIFQPDQKEQQIGVLHGTAVSMERINNDFQSELFTKLKGRQSDSDFDDEGISNSPMPMLSAEELAFGGRMKSAPVYGKSTNQESNSSLISVDGPENDNDPFETDWKSGVASIAANRSRPSSEESQSDEQMDVKDFEEVQMRTPALSNEAAKHRISVKPPRSRRASSRMSTKHREIATTTQLPNVTEESLSKSSLVDKQDSANDEHVSYTQKVSMMNDSSMDVQDKPIVTVIRTTIPVGNPIEPASFPVQRSEPRDIPSRPNTISKDDVDFSRPLSMSPLSKSPLSTDMLQDVKLRTRKIENGENTSEQPSGNNELSMAFNRAKRISMKYDEGGNKVKSITQDVTVTVNVKDSEQRKPGIQSKDVSVMKGDKSSPVSSPVKESSPITPSTAGVTFVLKKEPLRPGGKPDSTANINVSDNKTDYKHTTSSTTATKSDTSPKTELKSPEAKSPSKERLGSPEKLASPKEEYRLKRAARSKTLPEPPAHKEVLNKTKETDQAQTKSENRLGSPPMATKGRNDYDNVMVGARPIQSKRASWASETITAASTEPPWVVKARSKQADKEEKDVETKKLDTDTTVKSVDVKISEKPITEPVPKTSERNVTFADKTKDKSSISTEPKTLGEKPAAQTAVKSWAQTHSARPFERPSVQSSVKANVDKTPSVQTSSAKSAFEKSSVQSMKPVVSSQSSNTKSLSASVKPSISPQPSPVNKPLSQSVKPAFDTSSKPPTLVSQKPYTGFNKPGVEAKPFTQNTVKPLVSSNTNIAKSESIKSQVTSDTRKPHFGAKKFETDTKADTKTTTSSASIPKSSNVQEKTKTTQDKPKVEPSVPAWKQALNQKKGPANQVKIEIIDKPGKKPDVGKAPEKKIEEKPSVQMRDNKPKSTTEKSCSDALGNRSSKVLDMVKSFQKLQVT